MNDTTLKELKDDVEDAAKELLGEKLSKVVLYGSFARGDFDADSDIDFAFISTIPNNNIPSYNKSIGEITSELSIKYGILVSTIIISTETLNEYKDVLPFYMNLLKEGKIIYG